MPFTIWKNNCYFFVQECHCILQNFQLFYEIDSEINQNTTQKNIFSGNDNIKTIIDALKNNFDVNKKRQAAQALGNHPKGKEVLTALINALEKEQEPDVYVAIASSLGKLRNSQALKPLLKKLKELENGDRIARAAVVEALGNLNISKEEIENSEKEENREEGLLKVLIDRWRNEAMSNVQVAIEKTLRNLYYHQTNFYEPIRKALKKYDKDLYLNDNQPNFTLDQKKQILKRCSQMLIVIRILMELN